MDNSATVVDAFVAALAGALTCPWMVFFGLSARNTSVRTEVVAGFTTFLTMAYIIIVNPAILSQTGMPIAAVAAATPVPRRLWPRS